MTLYRHTTKRKRGVVLTYQGRKKLQEAMVSDRAEGNEGKKN
jgi:hypothetical protein